MQRSWLLIGLLMLASSAAMAQAEQSEAFRLPEPGEEPPQIAGHVRLDVVFPFAQDPLCPSGADCIFGGGAGLGGVIEWRWPSGVFAGIGYDAWFLDGNGVNEVTTMQVLRVVVRYQFLRGRQLHPWLGAGVGGLVFGDTFAADAAGGLLDLEGGIEIELSASLAFTVGILVRLFTTSTFRTRSDGVERAQSLGLDGAAALTLGLVLLSGR